MLPVKELCSHSCQNEVKGAKGEGKEKEEGVRPRALTSIVFLL